MANRWESTKLIKSLDKTEMDEALLDLLDKYNKLYEHLFDWRESTALKSATGQYQTLISQPQQRPGFMGTAVNEAIANKNSSFYDAMSHSANARQLTQQAQAQASYDAQQAAQLAAYINEMDAAMTTVNSSYNVLNTSAINLQNGISTGTGVITGTQNRLNSQELSRGEYNFNQSTMTGTAAGTSWIQAVQSYAVARGTILNWTGTSNDLWATQTNQGYTYTTQAYTELSGNVSSLRNAVSAYKSSIDALQSTLDRLSAYY